MGKYRYYSHNTPKVLCHAWAYHSDSASNYTLIPFDQQEKNANEYGESVAQRERPRRVPGVLAGRPFPGVNTVWPDD